MPNHQIFNERPESQDRALKELQAMGFNIPPCRGRAKARPSFACPFPGCPEGVFSVSVFYVQRQADAIP